MWWWGNGRFDQDSGGEMANSGGATASITCITSSSNGFIILETNFKNKYVSMAFIFVTEHFYT